MIVENLNCPLCGMYIPNKMHKYFGRIDTWATRKEVGGYKRIHVLDRFSGEDLAKMGTQWFHHAKIAVAALCTRFGFVKPETIIKEVLPSHVQSEIHEMHEVLKEYAEIIHAERGEVERLSAEVHVLEGREYSYDNAFLKRAEAKVDRLSEREVGWDG